MPDTVPAAHAVSEGGRVLIREGPPRTGRHSLLWRDSSPHFDRTRPPTLPAPPDDAPPPARPIMVAPFDAGQPRTPSKHTLLLSAALAWALAATLAALVFALR